MTRWKGKRIDIYNRELVPGINGGDWKAKLRHNAIRDTAALIMREAGCVDVQIEPGLQDCSTDTSLRHRTNTQAGARLDVSARGIFGTFERTFCDVRVTHPNCPSNAYKPVADIYKEHETARI